MARPRPTAWKTSTATTTAVTAASPGAQPGRRPITTTRAARATTSPYHGRALEPGSHTRSPFTAMGCVLPRGSGGVPRENRMATTHSGMTTWRRPGLACTVDGLVGSIQWIRWSCQRATGSDEIFSQSVSPTLAFLAESGGLLPFLVWLM